MTPGQPPNIPSVAVAALILYLAAGTEWERTAAAVPIERCLVWTVTVQARTKKGKRRDL